MAELLILLRVLAFLPLIRCPPQERLRLTLPVAVILTLLLSPLWVFCFGIEHFLSEAIKKLKTLIIYLSEQPVNTIWWRTGKISKKNEPAPLGNCAF